MIINGLKDLPKRMQNKIKINKNNNCWEWVGSNNGVGYGEIRINNKKKYTHRIVYELLVGPIPENKQIDHLCRNRCCCNPEHLEPVTPKENVNRGITEKPHLIKEYCINGHLYSENTYDRPDGKGRNCVQCVRDRSREYQRRKRNNAN